MAHILKNKNLEIHVDLPDENYAFSRFDWTGKIVNVKFQDIPVSTLESTDCKNEHNFGKGFYNEFGIDTALGFEEAEIGGWFHKIGVGSLKKDDTHYLFSKNYEIKPAEFKIIAEADKLFISCHSESINGYQYILKKEIVLQEDGFTIRYRLQNTGEKAIITDEYVHNFMAINNALIGSDYKLKFPFELKPELFAETVNPEQKVIIGEQAIKFRSAPNAPFFFSNLSGGLPVQAQWELIHLEHKIRIRETGSFQTDKVNLWGTTHVVSPELFFNICVRSGESTEWSRNYNVHKVK